MAEIPMIEPGELEARLAAHEAMIVDTRLPFDYYGGRVPGALSLPGSMILERVGQIPADRLIVFTCDDGEQSTEAAQLALGAGFTNVAVLAGGLDAWIDANLPIETASDGVNLPAPD